METCTRCGELIADQPRFIGNSPFHFECAARLIVNGLNHQLKLCHCYGGTEPPDPPEMTKREAAIAAYDHWRRSLGELIANPAVKVKWPRADED